MNLFVIPCRNQKGDYYTIYNAENGFHCHAKTFLDCQKVLKIAKFIHQGRPVRASYSIRRKAMVLFVAGKEL